MFKLRRIIKKILLGFLLIIFSLILIINITFNFFSKNKTNIDYSNWMYETLSTDKRIIDIAMLGAHDAFTHQIKYSSEIDYTTAATIQTGFTGSLIKGFSVKQSKTQVSSVTDQLKHGVRYFDIRLTYNVKTEQWMTAHTYFSTPFEDILTEINTFLLDNPGEFLILDLQHINGVEYTSTDKFNEILDLFDDSNVLSYAYNEGNKPLPQVTYGDVTQNKTKSGVIILSKFIETNPSFWYYGDTIRSSWANTDSEEDLYSFLTNEALLIALDAANTGNQIPDYQGVSSLNGFRVMQAVLTMQMNGEGILEAITSWSLLSKARKLNPVLLTQDDFLTWLVSMPIVMVDYSDSNYLSFNDNIMKIIMDVNKTTEI